MDKHQKTSLLDTSRITQPDVQSAQKESLTYLIDSHCHLHDREFFTAEQAEEMLTRAKKVGVEKIVCIGTDPKDSLAARDFAEKNEGVYWTYGIHPENSTSKDSDSDFPSAELEFFGTPSLPVAIGEVGLDYHYDGYDREAQIRLFEEMLQLAHDNNLPLVFHVREAFDDFFPIIANFPKARGVVHSFTDNKKNLRKILEATDFLVGVNGLATYSTLPTPPIDRILLETDAPFLTPIPFRGIINEPAYVREISLWLAKKLNITPEEVGKETTKNARELYGF